MKNGYFKTGMALSMGWYFGKKFATFIDNVFAVRIYNAVGTCIANDDERLATYQKCYKFLSGHYDKDYKNPVIKCSDLAQKRKIGF